MIINVRSILSPVKRTDMLLIYISFLFSFKNDTTGGEPWPRSTLMFHQTLILVNYSCHFEKKIRELVKYLYYNI